MVPQTAKKNFCVPSSCSFFLPAASLHYQPKQELAQHAKIELGLCCKIHFLLLMLQVRQDSSQFLLHIVYMPSFLLISVIFLLCWLQFDTKWKRNMMMPEIWVAHKENVHFPTIERNFRAFWIINNYVFKEGNKKVRHNNSRKYCWN